MGIIEVKSVDDRLTVISILAKNGYLVRQKRIESISNGKRIYKSAIEYELPDDPMVSVSRRDDD